VGALYKINIPAKSRQDTCLNKTLAFADHKQSKVGGRTDYYLKLKKEVGSIKLFVYLNILGLPT